MLKVTSKYFSLLLVLLTVTISCVKDVDFDQAEAISLDPIVASSIAFTQVPASRFFDNGMEIEMVVDSITDIEIFRDQFINDNLVKADLIFEVTNTISRSFSLEIEFLNEQDALQYEFSFDVSDAALGNVIITNYTEVIENENLDALKLSAQIVLKFRINPSADGSILTENSIGSIGLKSKGLFYFNINP